MDTMATLRCIDCHKLFSPSTADPPSNYDHRWCFVHAFKANKVETTTDFYALCLKHFQEMPPQKVVRKTIVVKGAAATMNIQELWAKRAVAQATKGKK
jgi:hypothetical protein